MFVMLRLEQRLLRVLNYKMLKSQVTYFVQLLNTLLFAFPMACFCGLSGIHEYIGAL